MSKYQTAFIVCLLFFCNLFAQETSEFIVVDQFGYLPNATKIAVIRSPSQGFDADKSFSPGSEYQLVNANSGSSVLSGELTQWKGGSTDISSGDKAWWFDFTEVDEVGAYYVLDVENNVRSYEFDISPSVYNEVLRHAFKTFYYQRVGFEKTAEYAGVEWADGASHMGPRQDTECRKYNQSSNASTEKDLSGGWYDAGDYNKYTSWTANYVVEMMKAYLERPEVWTDDFNIPESGNGIPDILDEAKWGIDHLLRMQQSDGSVLSIVSESHASPPSTATGPSVYGDASTSATLNTAGAYAIAAKVFDQIGNSTYADELKAAAENAWNWADENPDVLFYNNSSEHGTSGVGAGQQETDDYGRAMAKLEAACFLFDLTGKAEYKIYFDANYQETHLIAWNSAYPFEPTNQETLLWYTTISGATSSISNNILSVYNSTITNGAENMPAYTGFKDPYRAHIKDYTWGSNSVKMNQGNMFYNLLGYDVASNGDAVDAALGFINYIHGTNPLNMVYLSNMYDYGGENCVNEFYHIWFTNGSTKWDRVGESTYGPAPGFLVGGPNPSYDVDGCCPNNCGGANNDVCSSEDLSPPRGQPDQKSYKDFNTSWPLNSWSVTENSCSYQINYVRLLSKFVNMNFDCTGVENGEAKIDVCGNCTGGSTGIEPVTNPSECEDRVLKIEVKERKIRVYPNPTHGLMKIDFDGGDNWKVRLLSLDGKTTLETDSVEGLINMEKLSSGTYILIAESKQQKVREIVVKLE